MSAYTIAYVADTLIGIYILVLFARMILDWVRFFARDYRPRGIVLVLANLVYGLTDPPLKFLARFIPPARIGAVSLDVGFLVLIFALYILRRLVWILAFHLFV